MARGIFQSDTTHAPTPAAPEIERHERCERSKRGHVWSYWNAGGRAIPGVAETDEAVKGRTCERCELNEARTRDGEWI